MVAADSHRDKLNARGTVGGLEVAHLDSAAAIRCTTPSTWSGWQPSGVDDAALPCGGGGGEVFGVRGA